MADTSNAVEKLSNPKYRGLKPWKKGQAPKSPGRPRSVDLLEFMRGLYCDTTPQGQANRKRLLKTLEKKKPDEICHYVIGKPVERIDLSGELKHTVDPSIVAAAQVAIGKL